MNQTGRAITYASDRFSKLFAHVGRRLGMGRDPYQSVVS